MPNKKQGFTLWFTGLPCSGKTTIADLVAEQLKKQGLQVERLDGDIVRQGLTSDLGFSKEDRDKNIERVTFVSKLLSRNQIATIVSFVSPYRNARQSARENTTNFIEIYVKCPIDVCKKRDVKGMYQKAVKGEISNFTGVDDPYQEPECPDLIIESDKEPPEESAKRVLDLVRTRGYIAVSKSTPSFNENHSRSIVKALSWRFMATFLTILIVYAFTKKIVLSVGIGAVEVFTKMFFYYLHERAWVKVSWGRKHVK